MHRLDSPIGTSLMLARALAGVSSQDVASRETSLNRKVINTNPPDDNQNREPHKDREQRP